MSTQTPNLNLDLREASDIFNPLSTNANFETLDTVIDNIQKKGGVPTYTTTASANLLKLSDNPTPNETVFKFVAAGDANTWSYQETVNNIVSLDGLQKTVKAGEMYVAWVNAANAMVVIAWPDVVNAQTFDGKGPAEWATKVQLDAVNQTAQNAVTTAQAAATVANNALDVAQTAGIKTVKLWEISSGTSTQNAFTVTIDNISKYHGLNFKLNVDGMEGDGTFQEVTIFAPFQNNKNYRLFGCTSGNSLAFKTFKLAITDDAATLNVGPCYYNGNVTATYCVINSIYGIT